jgi:hypothetical protein
LIALFLSCVLFVLYCGTSIPVNLVIFAVSLFLQDPGFRLGVPGFQLRKERNPRIPWPVHGVIGDALEDQAESDTLKPVTPLIRGNRRKVAPIPVAMGDGINVRSIPRYGNEQAASSPQQTPQGEEALAYLSLWQVHEDGGAYDPVKRGLGESGQQGEAVLKQAAHRIEAGLSAGRGGCLDHGPAGIHSDGIMASLQQAAQVATRTTTHIQYPWPPRKGFAKPRRNATGNGTIPRRDVRRLHVVIV